jgi:endonuclease/exonuclease/phosphatase family metal-dependent hydrolase
MDFTVMTYDIHLGIDGGLEAVAGIVGEADVVALQQVGNDWPEGEAGNQLIQLSRLSGLGYYRYAAAVTLSPDDPTKRRPAPTPDDRPGFGVALISRFPLGPWTRHRLPKRKDEQRCILSGTVVTPKGPISVLATHLSPEQEDRAVQVGALLRHAQTQSSPLMVMGNLNGEADSPELAPLQNALRNAAGNDPLPSYPANDPQHAFDHIYLSKEFEILSPAMPLPLTGSNHLPVMGRVSL